MKYKLGDKVAFSKEYVRKSSSVPEGSLSSGEVLNLYQVGKLPESYIRFHTWEHEPMEGTVCGIRTVHYVGYSDYIGYEEGYGFKSIATKQVYLIATNMKEFHRVPEEFLSLLGGKADYRPHKDDYCSYAIRRGTQEAGKGATE